MAGNVINLAAAKLERSAHNTGTATCMNCKHEWQAVAPVETFSDLECPSCGTEKGVFKYGVVPEIVWTCNCGCYLFTISGTGSTLCWQCGAEQVFPDGR